MKKIIIKDLVLFYPDEFVLLGEEETNQMKFYNDSKGICIKSDDRHMIITVGYKEVNILVNLIISRKDLVKNTLADISSAMKEYDFKFINIISSIADDKEINGFSYEYISENIPMYGEAYIIKRNNNIYYLYLYSRKDNLDTNLDIWKDIINNLKWE